MEKMRVPDREIWLTCGRIFPQIVPQAPESLACCNQEPAMEALPYWEEASQ
jgi:hypothetical protein